MERETDEIVLSLDSKTNRRHVLEARVNGLASFEMRYWPTKVNEPTWLVRFIAQKKEEAEYVSTIMSQFNLSIMMDLIADTGDIKLVIKPNPVSNEYLEQFLPKWMVEAKEQHMDHVINGAPKKEYKELYNQLCDEIDDARSAICEIESLIDRIPLETPKAKRYDCIVAWGFVMMSFGYYVDAQVRKARRDNAPDDAFAWCEEENRWRTMSSDLPNYQVRSQMKAYLSVLNRETA